MVLSGTLKSHSKNIPLCSPFPEVPVISKGSCHGVGKKTQVLVNDVARILVRKRRSDHVKIGDLLKKAGLESMVC